MSDFSRGRRGRKSALDIAEERVRATLAAARSLQFVRLSASKGELYRLLDHGLHRYGVHIGRRTFITFTWDKFRGAIDIDRERID